MSTHRPPNIILTIADDQRGSALGCAGIEPVQTPHLDALAARGSRFTQAQHFGSCHGAICAPSRAMLHTGINYFNIDIAHMGGMYPPTDREVTLPRTLGQKLRESGYHAFGTGKWHNGVQTFHPSFDSGAQIFFGGMADNWFTPVHDFDPTGAYPKENSYFADGFSTEVFAQSAIDFIHSRRENDQPFFCYCAFTAPHDPRTPPDQWRRQYNPTEIQATPNMKLGFHRPGSPWGLIPETNPGSLSGRDELLLGTPRDWAEIQRSIAEYYGMISHMDEWIGKIHQAVADSGELENTIIIHTADHGLAVGQHGLLGKQNPYQHSLNVPLLMAGPGIPENQVCEQLCHQHDLHPTMLEWSESETSEGSFQSLTPLLDGTSEGRPLLANAFTDTHRCIRNQRYKLIEYNIEGQRSTQLFDLQHDPWETQNLAEDPSMNRIIESLRTELKLWQKEQGDDADWV